MCINTFNAIGGGICVLVHSYIYGSKLSPFSTLEPGAVVGLTATVNPIKWLQFVQIKYSPMAFSAAIRIASQGCYAETSIREKANYALPIRCSGQLALDLYSLKTLIPSAASDTATGKAIRNSSLLYATDSELIKAYISHHPPENFLLDP
ncbi:hypothetical protein VNO77_19457 [Canavalia gladiata]|uniref:Uncharacterized protein n=1 Tax=Canavalia gladiata TaxID=3824 RepID=A0AAN9QII4_CANGL